MAVVAQRPETRQVAYRNPLELPRIDYADIVANAAEGVCIEPPGTARVFERAPPAFHDDPDGCGLFQRFGTEVVTSPPLFTTSLRNATLVGFRSVLSRARFFTNDMGHLAPRDVADYTAALRDFDELSGLMPTQADGVFAYASEGREEIHLEGPVVLLTSGEAGNYGSFLYREIVKLIDVSTMPENWKCLCYVGHATFESLLEIAGLPKERLIRHDPRAVYHIDQAIIPGLRNPFALADVRTREFYGKMRQRCETGQRGRRLYVSRYSVSASRQAGRIMLNEHELIGQLRARGFDIIEPQSLTAAEQIATFASADLVVGPSGAGMFNAVFCHPGTKLIDIESEPHWIYPHCCLFASARLDYGIFEGRAEDPDISAHHKPWRVNIDALLQRIAAFAPA